MKIRHSILIAAVLMIFFQSCKTIDATVGAKDTCPVHYCEMKVSRTWIKYGRIIPMKVKIEADAFDYPNTKQYYYGGCRIRGHAPRIYKYYYCGTCQKLAKKERKKHESTTMPEKRTGEALK